MGHNMQLPSSYQEVERSLTAMKRSMRVLVRTDRMSLAPEGRGLEAPEIPVVFDRRSARQ